MSTSPTWNVALPEGAEPPFAVWVNGEPREEGADFEVEGRWLRFRAPLKPKVRKKGFGSRMVMLAVWSGCAYVLPHKKYPRKGLSWA